MATIRRGTLNTGYNGTRLRLRRDSSPGSGAERGDVPLRSAPYEYRQLNSVVSADYRINRTNSLKPPSSARISAASTRTRETWENKIRLGYVNRDFEAGTLRFV